MREFYKVVDYLKTTLESDVNVNTIKHGLRSNTDIEKKNIFPLAHIQVINSSIQSGFVSFTFEVAVVDKRNISKIPVIDKFLSNDNELDNLNTCFAVLNRMILNLTNKQNDDNITLSDFINPQPIIFEDMNILDGWRCEIELQIPNIEISGC